MELTIKKFSNYVIMFFLLAVSAIPFFGSNQSFTVLFAVLLIITFLFTKNQKIDFEIIFILLMILICILFQSLIFSYFKAITVFGQIQKILIGYLSIKLLKENFINYYLDILIFLSIISLIIFIPIFIFPSLIDNIINHIPSFLSYQYEVFDTQMDRKTLVFYNLVREDGMIRNFGPFWEPGAFGGFLIVAIIFNTIKESKLSTKINWLFFITIITTQSTTAYLAIITFVCFYLLFQNYSIGAKFLVVIIGIGGVIAFQTIPFLGEKIINENKNTQDAIDSKGGDTRMASAILDWQDIKVYPLTGRGIWPETRVDKKFEFISRNNGFTNFIAQWGIFIFIIYFYYYFKGFMAYCKIYNANKIMPILMLLIIWLISFSENYFNLPFFWALIFINIPLKYYLNDMPKTIISNKNR